MKEKKDIVKLIIESLEEKVNALNMQYMKLLAAKGNDNTFDNKDVEDFLNKKVEKMEDAENELNKFHTLGSKLIKENDPSVILEIENQIKVAWKESPHNTPKHTPRASPYGTPKHSPKPSSYNTPKKNTDKDTIENANKDVLNCPNSPKHAFKLTPQSTANTPKHSIKSTPKSTTNTSLFKRDKEEDVEKELENLKAQKQEILNELDNARLIIAKKDEELNNIVKKSEMESKIQKANKETIKNLALQLTQEQEKIIMLSNEKKNLTQELESLQRDKEAYIELLSTADLFVKDLEEQVTILKAKSKNELQSYDANKDTIEALKLTVIKEQEKIETLTITKKDVIKELELLHSQNEDLVQALNTSNLFFTQNNKELEEAKDRIKKMNENSEEELKIHEANKGIIKNLELKAREEQEKRVMLTEMQKNLTQKIETLQNQNSALAEKQTASSLLLKEHEGKIATLTKKLEEELLNYEANQKKIKSLELEVTKEQEKIAMLTDEKKHLAKKLAELQDQNNALAEKQNTSNLLLKEREEEIIVIKKSLEEKEKQDLNMMDSYEVISKQEDITKKADGVKKQDTIHITDVKKEKYYDINNYEVYKDEVPSIGESFKVVENYFN